MLQKQPLYYKEFQCIGSACKDNCCIGWEIDIDPKTLQAYQCQKGLLGERMQQYISMDESPHFILQEEERCPFLNQDNLCDIILELGEEALCDICTEHPRFYNCFGNYREIGVGCCCEEAIRCMLAESEPLQFETLSIEDEMDADLPDEYLWSVVYSLREIMFFILQNREFLLRDRLHILYTMVLEAQQILDEEEYVDWENFVNFYKDTNNWYVSDNSTDVIGKFQTQSFYYEAIRCYEQLEVLEPEWKEMLQEMKMQATQIVTGLTSFQEEFAKFDYVYEHFLVYLIYRHVLQAVWDGDILSKTEFVFLSYYFLCWMDILSWKNGDFTEEKQREHIKNYSKEIEYSTENIEALEEFLACNNREMV